MRVLITGGTGFVGSAIVPELLAAGHAVVGLARSDAAAAALARAGAEVHRGDLGDLDSLRRGAAAADGVVHCAYVHDFSALEASGRTDLRAVETLGAALEGTGRPLAVASPTGHVAPGRIATEDVVPDTAASPRATSEHATLALRGRGVRASLVRLPASVHGRGDHGFVPALIGLAREKGVSAFVGDGSNRWPAVHRHDAARLFRLALETAPAGAVLHGVAEEGVPTRTIAEVIGRRLGVPVSSVAAEDASEHFGWLGRFYAADLPASSARTRERFGWEPVEPGLVADLEAGHYFEDTEPAAA